MTSMRTAVVTKPGTLEIREMPLPNPDVNEVRVRIEGCGVCASNLSPWEGRPWFTYPLEPGALGHEAYGRVDALGRDVMNFALGQRVAILSYHAYAEYDVASAKSTVLLPSNLDGKPVPAEPLGC